jgi:alanyl-tRNA synthetase
VEAKVQHDVREDLTVYADLAPLYVARNINGLRAVFGEQYPDPVRVVSIGVPVQDLLDNTGSPLWAEASIEFCGGTHVRTTSDIGHFALVSEEAVAKGVRRITALTGVPAQAAFQAAERVAERLAQAGSLHGPALASAVQEIGAEMEGLTLPASRRAKLREAHAALMERVKAEQKQAGAARAAEAAARARVIGDDAAKRSEAVIVATIDAGGDRNALQQAVNTVMQINPRSAVMLLSVDDAEGKVGIVAGVPAPLVQKGLKAGDWVRVASEAVGGKGGGRPEMAMGGGTDVAKVKDAVGVATAYARKLAAS